MRVISLRLEHFRNIGRAEAGFGQSFNFIVGQNAQGKTNLLEALYYLSGLSSFRSRKSAALIRHGEPRALIEAELERRGSRYSVKVVLDQEGRRVWLNGKALQKPDDYWGVLAAVLFTPDDLALLKDGPHARRSFLDRMIFQVRPGYMGTLREFRHVVKQRNALLVRKPDLSWNDATHQAYLRQLIPLGARIGIARAEMTRRLEPLVTKLVSDVSSGGDAVTIRHTSNYPIPSLEDEGEVSTALAGALAAKFEQDRSTRATTVGPQRDDMEVTLNGMPLREHASQGQHRTVVLALKGAEMRLLAESLGAPPILLLDDLSSELDSARRQLLFSHLLENAGQVFLTATEPGLAALLPGATPKKFTIAAGSVEETP